MWYMYCVVLKQPLLGKKSSFILLNINDNNKNNYNVKLHSLWTVPKGLKKRREDLVIGGRAETIQTTALLSLTGEEFWGAEKTCYDHKITLVWKTCKSCNNDKPKEQESKMRRKKITMARIDYKKAYDIIPQSCLRM